MTIVAGITGALVGAALALWHQRASWRASQALVQSQRATAALVGMPLRVGLPALAFVGLAQWNPVAMLSALPAFGLVAWISGRRLARQGDG